MALRDQILDLLAQHPKDLFKTNEISKMLHIKSDSDDYQHLRHTLDALVEEGRLVRETRRRYGLPKPVLMP